MIGLWAVSMYCSLREKNEPAGDSSMTMNIGSVMIDWMFSIRSDATHTMSAGDRLLSQKMILESQHITLFFFLCRFGICLGAVTSSFQFNLFLFGSGMLIQWLFYNYFRSQIQLVFSQEEGSFASRWIIPLIISMPDLEDIYVIIGHASLYWRKWRYSDKGSNKCTLNI